MGVFAVLALVGPLLLLATTVASLWARGPLGWLAAVGLVVAVTAACRWALRCARRWWAGTKAPERVVVGPAERRRAALSADGTGRAPAAPPAGRGGTSPG